ncbi:hypothetical protein [Granulibacter bethesdensis]|uniref:hypothetical protein n=1 Tax=Granulibacter bethesdensis TaxID=364410 RepID=UPI0012FD7375|nr:hypothetical protein [Granulibacter bethesdensis]
MSRRRGETVCCAGVTRNREWRRQYPIHFRRLQGEEQFKRWQWIEYDWIAPGNDDQRRESRRVQEDTIKVGTSILKRERAAFLEPLITRSTTEAAAQGQSLTLIRPVESRFHWKEKTQCEITAERQAYEAAARQTSFLDPDLKALNPCPYAFHFDWKDANGASHKSTCDDWETAAMFYRREKAVGAEGALAEMSQAFNEQYPQSGMVFALGTHSRRAEQWLLVGVIRLDEQEQADFAF